VTVLEQARRLLALGFSIIPVPRPDAHHDGKTPATKNLCAQVGCHEVIAWKARQSQRTIDAELVAWFRTEQNLAIITGAVSNVVVVDGDSLDAVRAIVRRLPYTPWQTQTPRGYHFFYRHPGGHVANGARLNIMGCLNNSVDLRGDGGFVIAAGSVHKSGVGYVEAGDWSAPITSVPVFWRGWLARPTPRTTARPARDRHHDDRVVIERARRYLSTIPVPEIGRGSDTSTLYAACRLVRGFGLSGAEAEDLLWAWAGNRDGWTREWIARKVAHAERYGTEPLGALR
jgi:hypothetical protein